MKKFLLLGLFIFGLTFALSNFQGLASQGDFNSIILDFREDIPNSKIREEIQTIFQQYNRSATLNSIFSIEDNVYVVEGDQKTLEALRNSDAARDTEYIEPNYIYHQLEVPNDPEYNKQWNLHNINVEQAWDETKGDGVIVAVIDTGSYQST